MIFYSQEFEDFQMEKLKTTPTLLKPVKPKAYCYVLEQKIWELEESNGILQIPKIIQHLRLNFVDHFHMKLPLEVDQSLVQLKGLSL